MNIRTTAVYFGVGAAILAMGYIGGRVHQYHKDVQAVKVVVNDEATSANQTLGAILVGKELMDQNPILNGVLSSLDEAMRRDKKKNYFTPNSIVGSIKFWEEEVKKR